MLALVVGALLWRDGRRGSRLTALGICVGAVDHARRPLRTLLDPPPWRLDRRKYERLAAGLGFADAEQVLDVGCGTGRSLVGLAPFIGHRTAVTAIDVFDSRVILGNGPALARRNADRAGIDPALLRGDAVRLPVTDNSQDVVTISRVLHDLPDGAAADAALAEADRVLRPDGQLGLLEVPVTHDAEADPLPYWRDRVVDAGFSVTGTERVDGYIVIHAVASAADSHTP